MYKYIKQGKRNINIDELILIQSYIGEVKQVELFVAWRTIATFSKITIIFDSNNAVLGETFTPHP
jgi:hypothetical protein